MGIINFIKGGVHQLAISRPDGAKDYWVYKHPDQNIPSHAQLTVDSDEIAMFFKDGAFIGNIGPGRHTLDGNNIPFLGRIVSKFTGGDVFICEVFFVNTREMPSIKFGTSIGDIQDPQTQLRVRLMVYGEFSAKVQDPQKFVLGIVGQRATDNDAFLGWFKSQVQKTMKENVGEMIAKQKLPLMQITGSGMSRDIEASTLQECRKDIEPYGVEIMRFGDFTISMDPADKDRLDKLVDRMAYVNGMGSVNGGMAAYQQLAQAEMMMGAADGMKKGGDSGGGAFAGAGIGMGFAMANNMAGAMGQANAAAKPPQAETKEQIMATLKQLGELKAAGILDEAEFTQKKKELLAKL
jgi:membrane protease subunit (stomatin/prohibitin family)